MRGWYSGASQGAIHQVCTPVEQKKLEKASIVETSSAAREKRENRIEKKKEAAK